MQQEQHEQQFTDQHEHESYDPQAETTQQQTPFYGFLYYLNQEIHCVKSFDNGTREPYKDEHYQYRDSEQATRDDGALAEGRLGIELITGSRSNVIALDIECGVLAWDKEFNEHVACTDCVKIGSKGETRFYLYQGELSEQFYDGERLVAEILSDNRPGSAPSLCKLPPSIHPKTGKPYLFIDGVPLRKSCLEPLGQDALAYLRGRFSSRGPGSLEYATTEMGMTVSDKEGNALNEYPFIVKALRVISPNCDYHKWYRVAMAVRYALGCNLGQEVFTLWSSGQLTKEVVTSYTRQAEEMIRAFFEPTRERSGLLITQATLYQIAKDSGVNVAVEAASKEQELLLDELDVSGGATDPLGKPGYVNGANGGTVGVNGAIVTANGVNGAIPSKPNDCPTLPNAIIEAASRGAASSSHLKPSAQYPASLPQTNGESQYINGIDRRPTDTKITADKLPKEINYLDHPVQVARAFFEQGGEHTAIVFYADAWYAYSSIRNQWWRMADTALIDRHIEQFIINNGYNWLTDKSSKVTVEVPLPDHELAKIEAEEAEAERRAKEAEANGEKVERRGRKKARVKKVTKYDKYESIDLRQSAITEVRNAVARLAAREVQVQANKWLSDVNNHVAPDCLAVANGILDIRTQTLYDHSPEFFNLQVMPVVYAGRYTSGVCYKWLDALNLYFEGEESCIDQLQLAFGYTLLAGLQHKKVFVLQGDRHSGKTTITNVLVALLGDGNVITGSNDSLSGAFGSAGVDKAKMLLLEEFSLRSLRSREIDAIKRLSGGGSIYINQKHEQAYSAKVSARLWITTNDDIHKYEDSGMALSDRMTFWRCTPIPDHKKVANFEDVLLASEASGILSWALQGCERLLAGERIGQPKGRSAVLKELFIDAGRSALKELLQDYVVYDPDCFELVTMKSLYRVYQQVLLERGVQNTPGRHNYLSINRFTRLVADALPRYKHLKGVQFMDGRDGSGMDGIGLLYARVYSPLLVG